MYVTKLSVSISSDMIDNSCSVKELNETHARHGAHICGIVTIATTTTSVASGRRPLGPKANIVMSHGKHHYISSSSSSYMGPHHIHTHIHTYLTNCVLHAPPTTNNNNNHQKTEGFFFITSTIQMHMSLLLFSSISHTPYALIHRRRRIFSDSSAADCKIAEWAAAFAWYMCLYVDLLIC